MPGIFFNEFDIGSKFTSPTRTITETDVVMFAATSGDYNELHTSETFGQETPFKQRIAHGLLVLGISHGLMFRLGLFDGTGIAFLEVDEWKFTAPVYFNDTIHVSLAVTEKIQSKSKPDRGIVTFDVQVINQQGIVVQRGFQKIMVRNK